MTEAPFVADAATASATARPVRRPVVLAGAVVAAAAVVVALVVTGAFQKASSEEVLTEADRQYLLGRHFWKRSSPPELSARYSVFTRRPSSIRDRRSPRRGSRTATC